MTSDPQNIQRRSISTCSAASSSSAPHLTSSQRQPSPESSSANSNKLAGACSSCRRSKVKCDHDGSAPCKRCKNGGYGCVFKPKEPGGAFRDDEWRAKTDETLTRLVSAIDALVQQETSQSSSKRRRLGNGGCEEATTSSQTDSAGPSIVTASPIRGSAFPSNGRHTFNGHTPHSSPAQLTDMRRPVRLDAPPQDTTQLLVPHGDRNQRRPSAVGGSHHLVGLSTPAISLTSNAAAHIASEASTRNPTQALSSLRCSLPSSIRPHRRDGLIRPMPSKAPLLARPSQYRFPDPHLGSNDPRLDAIRMGLLSMHEARGLLSLYARTIEPFGFGLPDFPASAELTPVILSAIACVASLHSSSSDLRSHQLQLRADLLDRTLPYAPTTAEDEFNPESGIGTEEVVGACIWSAYDGSEEAWKVARAARWWSEKYSYETGPHAGLTVGEMVAILPPVRHVSIHDRVRVWLTAFLAELHQCEIHDKEPIMQLVDPAQYSQALLAECSSGAMTKQDAVLVFYARVAFLIARARLECRNPEELVQMTRDLTASWCTTRALLATSTDRRDAYDHTLDLHYTLAKAHVLSRACRIYEERFADMTSQDDVGMTAAAYVSRSQACQSACLDGLRLLLAPNAGFVGNLAALPSIYHFWIARCAFFLLELCRVDSLHHRLGLLVQGQQDDIVHTVGMLMQQYLADLAACDTQIALPGQDDSEPAYEVMRHPAMEGALAVTDLLASVQATA